METSSKKVLEAMPSFEDYFKLAEEIKKLSYNKMVIEKTIKEKEAETFLTIMTDPKYFINGKTVPVSYFDNAFKHGGINGEILQYRLDLAEAISDLEMKRTQFRIYEQMHDLHKTLAYQEKAMS